MSKPGEIAGAARARTRGVVLLALMVACGVFAPAASAITTYDYYYGSLTTDESRDKVASACNGTVGSGAAWTLGAGAYGKVVLITPDGSWIAADESNGGAAYVERPLSYNANKALCKNTTPWQITVTFLCRSYEEYISGCV